jgi:hypothetical protein
MVPQDSKWFVVEDGKQVDYTPDNLSAALRKRQISSRATVIQIVNKSGAKKTYTVAEAARLFKPSEGDRGAHDP